MTTLIVNKRFIRLGIIVPSFARIIRILPQERELTRESLGPLAIQQVDSMVGLGTVIRWQTHLFIVFVNADRSSRSLLLLLLRDNIRDGEILTR